MNFYFMPQYPIIWWLTKATWNLFFWDRANQALQLKKTFSSSKRHRITNETFQSLASQLQALFVIQKYPEKSSLLYDPVAVIQLSGMLPFCDHLQTTQDNLCARASASLLLFLVATY